MTKVFCDFCRKESEKMLQVKLPEYTIVEAYGGKDRTPLVCFRGPIVAADKDICQTCARKLIMAMGSMQGVQFIEST